MNTKLKQLTLLATAGFLLAACGQNNSAETTQAAQEATQANTKQSKLNPVTINRAKKKQQTINKLKKKRLISTKTRKSRTHKIAATFQKTVKLFIN